MKRYAYCTLFDTNYLDKGIVTIKSLLACSLSAQIYILAMDDLCSKVLEAENYERVRIITLKEFETPQLLECKKNRNKGEYCWTCAANLILFVIEKYKESVCTYVDADMFFYRDPSYLINEMYNQNKNVILVEHGFADNKKYNKRVSKSGRFCVEFNTFTNEEDSLEVLKTWCADVINQCSCESNSLGDQYYLNEWPKRYKNIFIVDDIGVGVAPWNVEKYKLAGVLDNGIPLIKCKTTNEQKGVVFFHFHGVYNETQNTYNIRVFAKERHIERKLIYTIYLPYLEKIQACNKYIEKKYGIRIFVKSHPAWSSKKGFLRKNFKKILKERGVIVVLCMAGERISAYIRRGIKGKKDIIHIDV